MHVPLCPAKERALPEHREQRLIAHERRVVDNPVDHHRAREVFALGVLHAVCPQRAVHTAGVHQQIELPEHRLCAVPATRELDYSAAVAVESIHCAGPCDMYAMLRGGVVVFFDGGQSQAF